MTRTNRLQRIEKTSVTQLGHLMKLSESYGEDRPYSLTRAWEYWQSLHEAIDALQRIEQKRIKEQSAQEVCHG